MRQEFELPPQPSYQTASAGPGGDVRRLSLMAAGIGGGLLALVLGWSMLGRRPHEIPLIEAPAGPVKVKPENPGGLQVNAGNEEAVSGAEGRLAPPPEAPQPEKLRERIEANRHRESQAEVSRKTEESPSPRVSRKNEAAASRKAEDPAPPKTEPPRAGAAQAQLTAAGSEKAALAEWARLERLAPAALAGRHPVVVKAERGGKTFYRLRTGGFEDARQVTAFCAAIKARGGDCAVTF